ncbi:MAG: hypothetical protein WBC51_08865 [Vicinamibacterales bacterium]
MIESLVIATVVVASSQQPAGVVDCRPAVLERSPPTRGVTENYYDQGRDSIAAIHPRHRLLAERRAGLFGRVEYSLLAYQPAARAPVSITAIAVDWQSRRAWSIDSSCVLDAWAGGLIDTLAAVAGRAGPPGASADTVFIEAVRSTVAHEIDPLLPPTSFEGWLNGLLESQARMQWEINDCGEQTGNPAVDRGREFPKCVQVRAELPGRRTLVLALSAGSQQKQPAGAPSYRFGVLIRPDGSRVEVRRLTDLASVIKPGPAVRF